jgi:hypothetical protein
LIVQTITSNNNTNSNPIKLFVSALAFGVAMGLGASAYATPIACNTADAMANGSTADACVGDNAIGASQAAETGFVNTNFQDGGDPFLFVDKTGEASAVDGFVLTVTAGDDNPYHFFYSLAVPDDWVGVVVDWVLVIKQASNSTIAYLFEDVTLGIDGGFNNFWVNGSGRTVNVFSHASGLLRVADDVPPEQIPEPGLLFLMGAGLLGLGLARRGKPA